MDYTAVLILACIFIPLERILPMHADQKTLRANWATDVLHLIFDGFMIKAGVALVIGSAMAGFRNLVDIDSTAWVREQPIWLQLIAIMIVADIGYYIAHRSAHEIPFLWKFHAVHHSSEELDWLATHRVHPVDQIYSSVWQMLPIYFIGFSYAPIMIFVLIYQAHAILLHSNVRISFGPLKWLLTSPDFHHWHHANQREAWDKNYASQFPIIDLLAGTHFRSDKDPEKYGLSEPMPAFYHQQLLHPFRGLVKSWTAQHTRKGTSHEQDA